MAVAALEQNGVSSLLVGLGIIQQLKWLLKLVSENFPFCESQAGDVYWELRTRAMGQKLDSLASLSGNRSFLPFSAPPIQL